MMSFFNLTLSGKHFICPSILNESFAGQSNLGCRSLSFMTLNTSFQSLLVARGAKGNTSDYRSDDSKIIFLSLFIYLFLEIGQGREKE